MPFVTHLAVSHEPELLPSQSSGPSGFPTRISTNLVAVVFQVSFVTPSLVPSVTVTGLGSAAKDALECSVLDFPHPTSVDTTASAARKFEVRRLCGVMQEPIGRDYSEEGAPADQAL